MMKQKEEEEKANKTKLPDPPVRRSSLTDKSANNIINGAQIPGNTAAINAAAQPATSPETACGTVDDTAQKISIADKIAALKANNAPARTFQPPTQTSASESSPDASSSSTIGERMAALRRKSVGSIDTPVPLAPPSEGSNSTDTDGGNDGVSAAPKSVAERMAALRASSAPFPVVKNSPSLSISAVFPPLPPPPASPAEPVAANDTTITPPKMTIAERMAALKASAAEHPTTPSDAVTNSANGTPLSTGGRRVSIGLVGLGAKINLAALSPNAVRPPVKREVEPETEAAAEKETTGDEGSISPKSNRVSFNAQENGEFRHVSFWKRTIALASHFIDYIYLGVFSAFS